MSAGFAISTGKHVLQRAPFYLLNGETNKYKKKRKSSWRKKFGGAAKLLYTPPSPNLKIIIAFVSISIR